MEAGAVPSNDPSAPRPPAADADWRIPVPIETARTRLRFHTTADDLDLLRFHSDAEVTRYLPWPVRDLTAVRATLQDKIKQTHLSADGAWLSLAVEHRATGRVIGEALVRRTEAVTGIAEIGYAFARDVHGQGYGTEVVETLFEVARRALPLRQVVAHVEAANDPSRRLLTRLGFELTGSVDGQAPSSLLVYGLVTSS